MTSILHLQNWEERHGISSKNYRSKLIYEELQNKGCDCPATLVGRRKESKLDSGRHQQSSFSWELANLSRYLWEVSCSHV